MIKHSVDDFHPLKYVVNACLHLLTTFFEFTIHHIYKGMNQISDILSKCNLDGDIGAQFLEQLPFCVT